MPTAPQTEIQHLGRRVKGLFCKHEGQAQGCWGCERQAGEGGGVLLGDRRAVSVTQERARREVQLGEGMARAIMEAESGEDDEESAGFGDDMELGDEDKRVV